MSSAKILLFMTLVSMELYPMLDGISVFIGKIISSYMYFLACGSVIQTVGNGKCFSVLGGKAGCQKDGFFYRFSEYNFNGTVSHNVTLFTYVNT